GGAARVGRWVGDRDTGGALPAGLLEVQPDRTPAVPARDAGLPGRSVRVAAAGPGTYGEGPDENGAGGGCGHTRRGGPGRREGARRVQGGHEDSLRRVAPEVELPGLAAAAPARQPRLTDDASNVPERRIRTVIEFSFLSTGTREGEDLWSADSGYG